METSTIYQPTQPAIAVIDYHQIDAAIWELSKALWRIESVANTASRAIDATGGDQFSCDLNGSFQAVTMLCKECQDILELKIQRPNDTAIKVTSPQVTQSAIASTKQAQS
jgi:hypothetical protein